MTHIDWSLDTATVRPAHAERQVVLDALRRRRYGDPDAWASAALMALLFAFGTLIALAGTATHRLVLATPVPIVVALGAAWLRQRRVAVRLHRSVTAGDPDAMAETARFLHRPEEAGARVSALRLASIYTLDSFESALFDLEATDAAKHPRPPLRSTRIRDVAVSIYCVIVGLVVVAAWAVELRG